MHIKSLDTIPIPEGVREYKRIILAELGVLARDYSVNNYWNTIISSSQKKLAQLERQSSPYVHFLPQGNK